MAEDKKGFAAMFAEMGGAQKTRTVSVGEEVTGVIVALNDETAFVDLGAKSEGILDRAELVDDEGNGPKIGDRIKAHVSSTKGGQLVLKTKVGRGDDVEELKRAFEHRLPVQGKVSGVNKGGLEVEMAGVRAFCPMSQIDIARVEDPGSWLGKELEFLVTKVESSERGRTDVVVSRRSLLEEQRKELAAATRATLEVGAVVRGKVTRVMDFGAFVDIGGLEGLIHKSELGFGRVDHPKNVLTAGDIVETRVTKLETVDDPRKPDRVSLSLKALQPDPFDAASASLDKGAIRKGKVVRLEPFGAFVALGDVEGLVHVSELSDRRINHPRDAVSVGDEIEVCVLEVDTERRRLSLSVKQVAARRERGHAEAFKGGGGKSLGTFADLLGGKLGNLKK